MSNLYEESKWVLPKVLERETGITPAAAEKKRYRGIWQEGLHFKIVNNRAVYNLVAINDWFEAA